MTDFSQHNYNFGLEGIQDLTKTCSYMLRFLVIVKLLLKFQEQLGRLKFQNHTKIEA